MPDQSPEAVQLVGELVALHVIVEDPPDWKLEGEAEMLTTGADGTAGGGAGGGEPPPEEPYSSAPAS